MTDTNKRRLYEGSYRTDPDNTTSDDSPTNQDVDNSATEDQNLDAEQKTWKKRYADLRSHNNSLTERMGTLENQLKAAQRQEIKLPSTKEELESFERNYPDVYRHISSIVLTKLLQEREYIAQETESVKEDLERVKRERGMQKILTAHKDFEQINLSDDFHSWAQTQPKQIQDWLFESSDPELCIKAIDLYKAEKAVVRKPARQIDSAASQVRTKEAASDIINDGGKRIWRASEIAKLRPAQFEQYESEIEAANREGRIDPNA